MFHQRYRKDSILGSIFNAYKTIPKHKLWIFLACATEIRNRPFFVKIPGGIQIQHDMKGSSRDYCLRGVGQFEYLRRKVEQRTSNSQYFPEIIHAVFVVPHVINIKCIVQVFCPTMTGIKDFLSGLERSLSHLRHTS